MREKPRNCSNAGLSVSRVAGYLQDRWSGLATGALTGGLMGGAIGGAIGTGIGSLTGRVCFVAGTQVVTGFRVRDEGGKAITMIAAELDHENSGQLTTQLQIVGYVTANIEDLKEGDYVLSRDQHAKDKAS